jgi:hypothetical protein
LAGGSTQLGTHIINVDYKRVGSRVSQARGGLNPSDATGSTARRRAGSRIVGSCRRRSAGADDRSRGEGDSRGDKRSPPAAFHCVSRICANRRQTDALSIVGLHALTTVREKATPRTAIRAGSGTPTWASGSAATSLRRRPTRRRASAPVSE